MKSSNDPYRNEKEEKNERKGRRRERRTDRKEPFPSILETQKFSIRCRNDQVLMILKSLYLASPKWNS